MGQKKDKAQKKDMAQKDKGQKKNKGQKRGKETNARPSGALTGEARHMSHGSATKNIYLCIFGRF